MPIITLDWETYYTTEYSLKKIPTILYVRDPKFKAHGVAIKRDDQPAEWITAKDVAPALNEIDWAQVDCVSHNALFDMLVLYERYSIRPRRFIDTLGLARALLPHDIDRDLGSLARLLGLGEKGGELIKSKGIRDLPPEIEAALAGYACQDAELTYGIYQKLWEHLPDDERELMHMTVRMGTVGRLHFDTEEGREALRIAVEDRRTKIEAVGTTIEELRSREKFANMLRARGVEPPTKINAKGKVTYAFSKQDPDFVRLQADPQVADLVAARLAATSTNAIKRIERLIEIAEHPPHTLPMPLNYAGAHTFRWSGAGKINVQNLNRGSVLRTAIYAPDGYVIIVVDSAQIELRVNMWFSGQQNVLDLLAPGEYVHQEGSIKWVGDGDVYRLEAARQFGIDVSQVTGTQRSFGKVVQLACGYGMGRDKFRVTCAIGPMGNDPIYISPEEADRTIRTYRANHPFIKASWDYLQHGGIPFLMNPSSQVEHKCITFEYEAITLPGGLQLTYPDLRPSEDGFVYGINGNKHRLYGGKLQENIVQALARRIIAEQMLEAERRIDRFEIVSQTHDEIIGLHPIDGAQDALAQLVEIMSTSPSWAPDLPLAAEGGYAKEYSK